MNPKYCFNVYRIWLNCSDFFICVWCIEDKWMNVHDAHSVTFHVCFGQVHLDCIFLKGCTQKASTWVSHRDHRSFRSIHCGKAIQRDPISPCAPIETLTHHGFTWMRQLGSFQWTKPWSGATSVVYVSLTRLYCFVCLPICQFHLIQFMFSSFNSCNVTQYFADISHNLV